MKLENINDAIKLENCNDAHGTSMRGDLRGAEPGTAVNVQSIPPPILSTDFGGVKLEYINNAIKLENYDDIHVASMRGDLRGAEPDKAADLQSIPPPILSTDFGGVKLKNIDNAIKLENCNDDTGNDERFEANELRFVTHTDATDNDIRSNALANSYLEIMKRKEIARVKERNQKNQEAENATMTLLLKEGYNVPKHMWQQNPRRSKRSIDKLMTKPVKSAEKKNGVTTH